MLSYMGENSFVHCLNWIFGAKSKYSLFVILVSGIYNVNSIEILVSI